MEDNKDINDDVVRDFLKKSSEPDFKVPDNYFEGFQKNIHAKIHNEKPVWWRIPQVRIGLTGVACLALMVLVLNDFTGTKDLAESNLSEYELLAYYSDNVDEISEDEILGLMTDDDFQPVDTKTVQTDSTSIETKEKEEEKVPTLDDLSDEEIYEYMLDEGYGDGEWDNL